MLDVPVRALALSVAMSSLTLIGCGGGGGGTSNPGPTPPPAMPPPATPALTPANSVYVDIVNDAFYPPGPSMILQLSRTADGNTTPGAIITGPKDTVFGAMAVDASGNLYVAGQIPGDPSQLASPAALSTTEILVYAPGANGTATPTAITTVGGLFNNAISGMDTDPAGNLYVTTGIEIGSGPSGRVYSGVAVYSMLNGILTVTRSIAGLSTGIAGVSPIAVSGKGDVFVAGGTYGMAPQSVLMFPSAASGDVASTAAITGSNTGIGIVGGLAVDHSGNLYVKTGGSVLEFAAGATGNVAPMRTITLADVDPDTNAGSINVDAAGNVYAFGLATGFAHGVQVYPPTASGAATPLTMVTPTSYTEPGYGLAVQR